MALAVSVQQLAGPGPVENVFVSSTPQQLLALRGWPHPRGWRRPVGEASWQPWQPVVDLQEWLEGRRAGQAAEAAELAQAAPRPPAFRAFAGTVPAAIRADVGSFRRRQWALLQLASRSQAAADLLGSNAPLAFALTDLDAFDGRRVYDALDRAAELARQRQRTIVERLGFPPRQATVKIFRKLVCASLSIPDCLELRRVLENDGVRERLSHLARIDGEVLALVADPRLRTLVSSRLLHELAARADVGPAPAGSRPRQLLEDVLAMLTFLRRRHGHLRFDSLTRLQAVHDELVEDMQTVREPVDPRERRIAQGPPLGASRYPGAGRRRPRRRMTRPPETPREVENPAGTGVRLGGRQGAVVDLPPPVPPPASPAPRARPAPPRFPEPPLPGNGDIVPLCSRVALLREGRAQHSCVGAYGRRVLAGQVYVYQVLRPERATLSIVRRGERWELGELKAVCNQEVADETRAFAERWLAGASLDINMP